MNKTEGCSLCPWSPFFPARYSAKAWEGWVLNGASFVSPDQGAIPRCEAMMSAAGVKSKNLVYFEKHRTESGIVHHLPVGKVERCAVIVDDILDTGTTLMSPCEKLLGAEERYIYVTHGLFTGTEWHNLWSLPVKHIFCADTIPACANVRDPRITVLPVAPVLREGLLRAYCKAEAASYAPGSFLSSQSCNNENSNGNWHDCAHP